MNIKKKIHDFYSLFKYRFASLLFANEVEQIRIERETYKTVNKILKKERQKWHEDIAKLTINDLVREQLKGVSLKDLRDTNEIPEMMEENDSRDAFLGHVKSLQENPAYEAIRQFLIRRQIIITAKEAEDLTTINFGRATINGLELYDEEVGRLVSIFDNENKKEEDFDEHGIN